MNVKCILKMQLKKCIFFSKGGSALSLIHDDHLVKTMQIKLGPALKIMSKFNELKTKFNSSLSNNNKQLIQT